MEVSRLEDLPPPPGIINSIRSGFDTIAAHLSAIFLPLMLNLFLWLGPRLRINEMFDSFLEIAIPIWRERGIPAQDVERVVGFYESVAEGINMLWLLRTLPIGVPNLFPFHMASSTPLGGPDVLQASVLTFPLWFLFLTFLGWMSGGLYFYHVSKTIALEEDRRISLARALVQTVLVSILCNMILMMIGIPLFILLALVIQLNAVLANLFVLFLFLSSMWIIVPLFFWSHGVFVRNQNVITSILSSIQLARFTMPTSSIFVLIVFMLAVGLNFLWRIPPADSWMMLVGILGHSFVTTALLAASFIYYRDMSAWIQIVVERLRPNQAVKQA
jgi:hypothetical protein